ncbi:MAG: hypothetical protein AB7D57_00775 [Desulfovibrionaceae bacterium]
MSSVLFGVAADAAAGTAATSGLLGTAGGFAWGQTLTTLGLGATALSAVAGGGASAGALQANAKLAEQQALYAEDKAQRDKASEQRESARQLELLRQQQRQDRGRRMAQWGASGVQAAGSPLRVMEGVNAMEDRNAAVLLSGSAARQRNILYGGQAEAAASRSGASLLRSRASSAGTTGWLSGLSTLALGSRYYG